MFPEDGESIAGDFYPDGPGPWYGDGANFDFLAENGIDGEGDDAAQTMLNSMRSANLDGPSGVQLGRGAPCDFARKHDGDVRPSEGG